MNIFTIVGVIKLMTVSKFYLKRHIYCFRNPGFEIVNIFTIVEVIELMRNKPIFGKNQNKPLRAPVAKIRWCSIRLT